MKGGEDGVGLQQRRPVKGNKSVVDDGLDGVDVVVVAILGTKKRTLRSAGVTKIWMSSFCLYITQF